MKPRGWVVPDGDARSDAVAIGTVTGPTHFTTGRGRFGGLRPPAKAGR